MPKKSAQNDMTTIALVNESELSTKGTQKQRKRKVEQDSNSAEHADDNETVVGDDHADVPVSKTKKNKNVDILPEVEDDDLVMMSSAPPKAKVAKVQRKPKSIKQEVPKASKKKAEAPERITVTQQSAIDDEEEDPKDVEEESSAMVLEERPAMLSPIKPAMPKNCKNTESKEISNLKHALKSLEDQYNHLETVGIKEAEIRYDELKSNSESRFKVFENIIAKLKDQVKMMKPNHEDFVPREEVEEQIKSACESERQVVMVDMEKMQSKWSSEKMMMVKALEESKLRVSQLQEEVDQAQQELAELSKSNLDAPAQDRVSAHSQLELSIYKDLTGLYISDIKEEICDVEGDDDEIVVKPMRVYYCRQVGAQGDLVFVIKVPLNADDSSWTYAPLLGATSASIKGNLPPYLLEEIEFDRSMSSQFFWRVCNYMKSLD